MRKNSILAAFDKLSPLLTEMCEKAGIPGFTLQLVFEDGDHRTLTEGTKRKGFNEPPDENTIFMIGSCSKSFTGVCAALLAQAGKLDLNRPVSDFLPYKLERNGEEVKLIHLLSNSSGLPNMGLSEIVSGKHLYGKIPGIYAEKYPFDDGGTIATFMQGADAEMVGAPGKQFIYSNEGFSLAAHILAQASGKAYPDLVDELIFTPLGMKSSGYRPQDFPAGSDFSCGHLADGRLAGVYYEPAIAGAGGVLSSVADMGKYVQALLCEGNLGGKRVFPRSVIHELEIGRIPHQTAATLVGEGFGQELYSLGLMIYPDFLGTRVITHGGSTGNFSSSIFYNRELGFGIAVLANGGNGEGIFALFAFMVVAQALGKDPFSVFSTFKMEKEFRSLEGIYTSRGDAIVVKISFHQGQLWWESLDGNGNSPQGTYPLNTSDPTCRRFGFVNGPGAESQVEFFSGEDGLMRLHKDRNVLVRGRDRHTA
ncbi:MAG: beta-lactamase family protein [Chloroflexi bacterium]|nr:beta-lactamase family protein [Chloroflexota bacterium]